MNTSYYLKLTEENNKQQDLSFLIINFTNQTEMLARNMFKDYENELPDILMKINSLGNDLYSEFYVDGEHIGTRRVSRNGLTFSWNMSKEVFSDLYKTNKYQIFDEYDDKISFGAFKEILKDCGVDFK